MTDTEVPGTWHQTFNAFVLSLVSVRLLWYICYVLDKAFYVTQYWGDCSPIYCHQKVEQYRCFWLLFVEHICPPCSSFLFIIGQTFLLHHKCKPKVEMFGKRIFLSFFVACCTAVFCSQVSFAAFNVLIWIESVTHKPSTYHQWAIFPSIVDFIPLSKTQFSGF